MSYIAAYLRTAVIIRANYSCEYCLIHANYVTFVHEVDHVIAQKHGGATILENLAYACGQCNRNKGSELLPLTQKLVPQHSYIIHERRVGWNIFNLMVLSLSL